jgi:hypothetical protein
MAVDRIHDSKSAVSDFTDRVADDAATNAGISGSGGSTNGLQTNLTSALGGDDATGSPSLHAGFSRPVTISFVPPSNSAAGEPTGSAPLAVATVAEEFFPGNFTAASPAPGGGGFVEFDSRGGGGSASGGATVGGGSRPASWGASNAAGMTFVINWDSSTNSAPLNFRAGVKTAVQYFLNHFASPVTITLNVGWGEVAGQRMSSGALGESETNIYQYSYSQLYGAMANQATTGSPDQVSAAASLPNPVTSPNGPIGGSPHYWVSSADAKALNLPLPTGASSVDGWVGFGSRYSWWFGPGTGTQGSNQYDFVSVAEHEISEVMGRISLLGASINDGGTIVTNSYENMDLFRYSSAGTRSLVGGQTAYLSFDSGNTHLLNFNTTSGGDWGDWQSSGTNSAGNDVYDAFSSSGHVDLVSAVDNREMNVLGYTLTSPIA